MDANSLSLSNIDDYGDVLNDRSMAQFLASESWACQQDRTYSQVWVPPTVGARVAPVFLPRDNTLDDYKRRLAEAAIGISRAYGWSLEDLIQKIAAVRADLFLVRVVQSSMDGTIPLRQASSLLENVDQMMRSAALTTYNPHTTGRGRLPTVVNEFLNDDLRMGHTKHGSFIITIAARVDEELPEDVNNTSGASSAASHEGRGAPPPPTNVNLPSFSRRVMTNLAETLHEVREYSQRGSGVDGIQLPVAKALNDMSRGEGLKALDLSFEWAASQPKQRSELPDRFMFDRPVMDSIPSLVSKLERKPVVNEETIIGPVTELKRSDAAPSADDQEGEVVIRAEVDGRLRRITVALSGRNYDLAIQAHRLRLPFTVTGVLRQHRNTWRMDGSATVERSFLEHELARRGRPDSE